MERYYVTKEHSHPGMREVHRQGCQHMPPEGERVFLGICRTSNEAAAIAQNLFGRVCPCSCCLVNALAHTGKESRPVALMRQESDEKVSKTLCETVE